MKAMIWKAPSAALVVAMTAILGCDAPRDRLDWAQQGLVDGGKPPCPKDGGTCVETSPKASLLGACTDDRWLVKLSDPNVPCPVVGGATGGSWVEAKLFDESGAPAMPPSLKPYCSYEWSPAMAGLAPDTVKLKAVLLSLVDELAQDCYVVGPSGSNSGVDAAWRSLREDFHQETGRLADLPRGGLSPVSKTRVAVVDSAPTGYVAGAPRDDRSGHGHAVGWIIREHACPSDAGACIGQIADQLALPQVTLKARDPVHGGYFGSQGQVAKAVYAAVHSWRAFNAAGGNQPRLVINLSLGWDPTYGDGSTGSQPLSVRAVQAAITHAVCQGALVIAAAGNDPGGPGLVAGPMLPGGWEMKPAPTIAQCNALEGPSYSPGGTYPALPQPGSTVYQPLVHAVSGVRADDSPLLNSRPGGLARTVAPGAQALAEDNGDHTDVLTGTSAAAAVTSAIAATLWGYRPQLTGPEVMALIRQSGEGLGTMADFCLGGHPCPKAPAEKELVRVNLCQAVELACSGGLESCPTSTPACTSRPAHTGTMPSLNRLEMTAMSAGGQTYDAGSLVYGLSPVAVCDHAGVLTSSPSYPSSPCPRRQFYGTPIRPWTGPQPSSNACPVCTVERQALGSYTVTLSIDDEYTTTPLSEPVLRVNGMYDVDLSLVGTLSGGDVATVENLDLSYAYPIETAEITFRMVDGVDSYSSESELIVQP